MINRFLNKPVNTKTILLLVVFVLFYLKGLVFVDPDFGWRVKAGEFYWINGIPETDIFTYTMPNFPWVDHAWGTTLIFYLVNEYLGYPLLVFLMVILVLTILLILTKSVSKYNFKNSTYKNMIFSFQPKFFFKPSIEFNLKSVFPFSFFPLILVTSILLPFFGVRAQIVSWFMFSVLLYWISDEKLFNKIKLFLPAFFLLWVNLHGSFALGIVTLFLYLTLKIYKARKLIFTDCLVGLSSLLVTFINPYGSSIWREVWSSASDSKLRFAISEWMPSLTMFNLAMVFLICLSFTFILKYRKKFSRFELILYFFLLSQAVISKRQLPLWAIFTLPLTVKSIYYFWNDLRNIVKGELRFVKVYKLAWVLSLIIFMVQVFLALKDAHDISRKNFYPVDAVSYLSENIPKGEIFSDYGWGGYLILNLPRKKVFIDGRMPSWRWDPGDTGDLSSAFDTYNEVLSGKVDYRQVFDKYGVDTVLSQKYSEASGGNFYNKAANILSIFGWEKNDFNFLKALEEDGWKKVYEDDVSEIYKKE